MMHGVAVHNMGIHMVSHNGAAAAAVSHDRSRALGVSPRVQHGDVLVHCAHGRGASWARLHLHSPHADLLLGVAVHQAAPLVFSSRQWCRQGCSQTGRYAAGASAWRMIMHGAWGGYGS